MEKKVTVLTPNGRRQTVKVTPNTTLLEVLEDVSNKHGYDSDIYCLQHHNKEIDLTQMFRFTGLPNNCQLEMSELPKKRVAAEVNICLQLEDGSRLQGLFKPADNLWHVAEQLMANSISQYSSPVAIYMRKDIVGKESMTKTTLKSLGITVGSALIRIINKNPDELKVQANVYAPPKAQDSSKISETNTEAKMPRKTQGSGGFAITQKLMQSLKPTNPPENETANVDTANKTESKDEPMESSVEKPQFDWGAFEGRSMRDSKVTLSKSEEQQIDTIMDIEPEITIIGEREAILYSLESSNRIYEDLPDSFFDLTEHDLRLVLRDLQQIANGNENAPLLTEKLRALEESKTILSKIGRYKNCIIRIQFPNRHVLQGLFKPIETIADVNEFVRKFLQEPHAKFHLFTIPPKKILPLDETLLELNCVPTALLHFALDDTKSEDEQIFVRPELLDKLTSLEGALYAANKIRNNTRTAANAHKNKDEVADGDVQQNANNDYELADTSKGAIPKRNVT